VADRHVVVVGGGLAGISAALRLADARCAVTLLEARPRLGGAAFSFRRGELSVDNGQHVFLRCCEAYRWLLDRLAVTDQTFLQDRLDIPVLAPDGHRAHLRRTRGVPAPGHLTAALAGYRLLTPADRLRAVRGALALRLLNPADPTLDDQTLGAFLRRHGQREQIVDALWGIVATATLNLAPADASLALAAKVFRTGLLDHAPAGDVGYALAPLGDLHSVAAQRALTAAGVEVLPAHRVEHVGTAPTVRVRGRSGVRELRPDAVVLAMPPRDAFRVAPALAGTPVNRADALQTAPIVNVHILYDRKVTDLSFGAAVGSPVQWFFDRTHSSGLTRIHPRGQYLAVTVSAADAIIDTPSAALRERFLAALADLLPAAGRADVLDSFVTRERHATFRQAAGTAALRPGPSTTIDGLWLAGAWTATGWPDTMESAVRSGIAAAEALLDVPAHNATRFAA
jgi:squalene-associated FAD-dependent desaturase